MKLQQLRFLAAVAQSDMNITSAASKLCTTQPLDGKSDEDLVKIDASHLLPAHTTWIGFARDALLRRYMYDFLLLLAPHLDRAGTAGAQSEVDALFADMRLPMK